MTTDHIVVGKRAMALGLGTAMLGWIRSDSASESLLVLIVGLLLASLGFHAVVRHR